MSQIVYRNVNVSNFRLGKFQFQGGILTLTEEADKAQFLRLLEQLPQIERQNIFVLGEEIVSYPPEWILRLDLLFAEIANLGPEAQQTARDNLGVINGSGAGGVTDGDKGDIIVSAGGTTWLIDPTALTIAKVSGLQTALDGKEATGVAAAAIAAHLAAGDPHPQYLTPAEGNAAYAPIAHSHIIGDVTGLQTALDNKLDDSQATAYGLSLLGAASAAATKTLLALVKGDVGLGNVDNTSDANKPVSTATQTALNLKANLASPTFTGTVSGITKSMVGLANVDNTADVNKPVSTAQQAALDLKQDTSTIDERIRDTIGATLVQGANVTITVDDVANTITIAAAGGGGGGVTDGDKGDIVVSAGGTTWNIDSSVISTFARTLLDDADAAAMRATLGLGTAALSATGDFAAAAHVGSGGAAHANVVAAGAAGFMTGADKTKLDGVAAGATANSSDATLLNRANHTGTQGIGTVTISTSRLAGRTTAGSGALEEISVGSGLSLAAGVLSATGGGGGGSGDVVGPASATDLAIARFDTTTGKLLQDSKATVDDEGAIRSATNAGANPVAVPLVNYIHQVADYNLANSISEQQIFNQTTNGRLTLPAGYYRFKAFIVLTGMSATSGSFAFDPIGAGTAVADRFAYDSYGLDNSTQPNAVLAISGVGSFTQETGANVVLAGTGTGARATLQGVFRITTGGTIIPSLKLSTASAAVTKAGSHFIIEKIGESGEARVGNWD